VSPIEEVSMPQLLVVTDLPERGGQVVYRERIASTDLDSRHFSDQLVERVGWALRDADELSRREAPAKPPAARR
jgi:hypothetical protein